MFDFHDFRIFKGLNKWQISKCPSGEAIKIVLFIKEYVVEAIKCMVKNSHFMVNTVYIFENEMQFRTWLFDGYPI